MKTELKKKQEKSIVNYSLSILNCVLLAAVILVSCPGCCKKDDPAPTPTLSVSSNSLTFISIGGTETFDITASNTNWTVTSDKSWITVSPASGNANAQITVTVEESAAKTARKATITVTGTGDVNTQTIEIIQQGGLFSFTPVTGILGGPPATGVRGTQLTLTGSALPVGATNRAITWSVKNNGGITASISGGNTLNSNAGAPKATVVVTATIVNGLGTGSNFVQDYSIELAASKAKGN